MLDTIKMGRNGTVVIPATMRRRLGLNEGELLMIEDTAEGITIRPAVAVDKRVVQRTHREFTVFGIHHY